MSNCSPFNIKPPSSSPEAEKALRHLIDIMAILRDPESGCPWDLKQTHETIAPYTIEEAYEVAEAINNGSTDDIKDELGDLLLQVVFQARIAEEAGNFDFSDITVSISEKMLRRHPHIFEHKNPRDADAQKLFWEDLKEQERKSKNKIGVLDDVATTLPPTTRAFKLQKRAARVGFDWKKPEDVFDKIDEELNEIKQELINNTDHSKLEDEIGDLLFAVINLARKYDVDPDKALASTNRKFCNRFNYIESKATSLGKDLKKIALQDMENWWNEAKLKK